MDRYDAGILNDFGGGNVGWWQDYMRHELNRAEEFYEVQFDDLNNRISELEAERDELRKVVDACVEWRYGTEPKTLKRRKLIHALRKYRKEDGV